MTRRIFTGIRRALGTDWLEDGVNSPANRDRERVWWIRL